MGKRQQRQELIKELITTHRLSTQLDLARMLVEAGMECTQATVSRDIIDMRLEKDAQGCYVTPELGRLSSVVADVALSVHAAGNLVVIKTRVAGAGTLADALDKAHLAGTLGSIAGDDTIFVATEGVQHSEDIQKFIMSFMA